MKNFFRRSTAAFLVAGLILTSSSASEFLGTPLCTQSTTLSNGLSITDQTFWSSEYSDLRTEYYSEYTPGSSIYPVVVYGDYIKTRQTIKEMSTTLEERGLRVIAGINTNFYHLKNGIPIGLVVSDGFLRSAIPNHETLGFKGDGTVIFGSPEVKITAQWSYGEASVYNGNLESPQATISFSGYNKVREDGGYYLFSDEFWTNTLNNVSGVDVILRPIGDNAAQLALNQNLLCEVIEIRNSTPDNHIPVGCFVISINNNSSQEQISALSSLNIGTKVTLESSIDPEWSDVTQATSGLYPLVENGEIVQDLSDSIKPCTAVGLKPDGSLIFYIIDGRQSGYSIGASYAQVAGRLIELGCTEAFAMDGGGSASFGATFADFDSFQIINQPSDGSPRSVSVGLFLVTEHQATGNTPNHYYISTENNVILQGSTVPLRVTALDHNYLPVESDSPCFLTSNLGTISEDQNGNPFFTSGVDVAGPGNIIGYSLYGAGIMDIVVVDQLSSLTLSDEDSGTTLSALALTVNEQVNLSVTARSQNMKVAASDADFTWTVEGPVGSVDENGVFTAAHFNGKGTLTVSWKDFSVSIPIIVTGGTPFTDIKDHWAEDYIVQLYALGITNGFVGPDGMANFGPQQSITRGELFTMIVRMLNTDLNSFEHLDLPFADKDTLPEWILPYIKAAYGLGLLRGDLRDGLLYADINGLVSRETSMVVIGRSLDHTLPADLSGFEDSSQISDWAMESLQTLVALGVIAGDENQMLNPGSNALRAEVAKIIISMLALPSS